MRHHLRNAQTYEEWIRAAKNLDNYLEYDEWKEDPHGSYYDANLIRKVNKNLRTMRENNDVANLANVLEACVKANFAGIENFRMYSETYYGTKELIEDHVDEVTKSLDYVRQSQDISLDDKRQLFKYAFKNYGQSALSLSGGACFGYYHFGVIKAMLDAGLVPKIVTGTSAGGLIAAMLCCYTDDELKRLLVPDLHTVITACDEGPSIWIPRYFKSGARFDTVRWAHKVQFFTRGSMTFREAYQRTGRILNISVVPFDMHSPPKLINHVTAPDCVIWTAVIASAAVPGIINPVVLMMKSKTGELLPYNFGHKWKDGSLKTDIPLQSLNTHFNVNYSIVSQVNPHIHLFFYSPRGSIGRPVSHRRGKGWRGGFLSSALEQYFKLDILKNLKVARDLELLPRFKGQDWSWVWLQKFEGSVTIWPKTIFMDWVYILSDPTRERMERFLRVGQQVTWPRLHMIENRLRIERAVRRGRDEVKKSMLGSIRLGEGADIIFSGSETETGQGQTPLDSLIDKVTNGQSNGLAKKQPASESEEERTEKISTPRRRKGKKQKQIGGEGVFTANFIDSSEDDGSKIGSKPQLL